MKTLPRRLVGWVIAATLALGSAPAWAKPSNPKAIDLAKKGNQLYADGDFEGARDAFQAGFKIEPDPVFLYGIGQALNQLGDCRGAIRSYKQVEESPAAGDDLKTLAQEAIYACADKLAAEEGADQDETDEDEGEDEDEVDDEVVPDPPPVVEPDPPKRKWYLDPAGDTLVGLGVVGAGAGAGLLVAAQLEQKKDAASYEEFDERQRRVRNFRIAGGVVVGVGGALLIGGIVRWILVGSRPAPSSSASIGVLYDGSATGLSLSGRF